MNDSAQSNAEILSELSMVSGVLTHRRLWDKGRAPTRAEQAEYNRIVPFANQMLFFREGRTNDVTKPMIATAYTDEKGEFSLKLPLGVYSVVTREKGEAREHAYMVGQEALRAQWLSTPAFVIEVNEPVVRGEWFIEPQRDPTLPARA
eukprot:TRINITY_DN10720_c0_g2_i1.p1 TRINITY_DN10720_c0_g2~~TRINITY_DN10720_c0_g2_i1.p1  ORF type:complete len:148 (-),score=45.15 TRINITY_DN10720_c0_g2_i1:242-685(-)